MSGPARIIYTMSLVHNADNSTLREILNSVPPRELSPSTYRLVAPPEELPSDHYAAHFMSNLRRGLASKNQTETKTKNKIESKKF